MKFSATLSFLFISATWVSAQTATAPIAGIVLDGQGQLVSVRGVLQTLLPGSPFGSYGHIESVSFGSSNGAIKTDSQLLIVNATGLVQSQWNAPAGPAIFGLGTDGNIGWVYYPATSRIQSIDGSKSFSALSLGDAIVSLGAATDQSLTLLARTGTQLWAETVALNNGAILTQSPISGSAPAIYFQGGWLVTTDTGMALGSQTFAASSPVVSLQTAGPNSVAINSQWLLNGAGKLLEIPAIVRIPERRSTISPIGVIR